MKIRLTEKYKKELQQMNKENLEYELSLACSRGHLDIVQYLLTSPDLIETPDIDCNKSYPLIYSCLNGHYSISTYLLTSPDLIIKENINNEKGKIFKRACLLGNLDLIKYLLTSPELKEHANIHIDNDAVFKNSVMNNKAEIIEYFIFNYKIKKTTIIKRFLTTNKKDDIIQMFEKRDLEQKLNIHLQINKNAHHKMKI